MGEYNKYLILREQGMIHDIPSEKLEIWHSITRVNKG